jgi:hypothetical protein
LDLLTLLVRHGKSPNIIHPTLRIYASTFLLNHLPNPFHGIGQFILYKRSSSANFKLCQGKQTWEQRMIDLIMQYACRHKRRNWLGALPFEGAAPANLRLPCSSQSMLHGSIGRDIPNKKLFQGIILARLFMKQSPSGHFNCPYQVPITKANNGSVECTGVFSFERNDWLTDFNNFKTSPTSFESGKS